MCRGRHAEQRIEGRSSARRRSKAARTGRCHREWPRAAAKVRPWSCRRPASPRALRRRQGPPGEHHQAGGGDVGGPGGIDPRTVGGAPAPPARLCRGSAGFLGLPMRPFSRRRRRAGRPRRLSIRHRTRGRSEGRAVAAYPQPGRAEVWFVVRDAPRLSARDACVRVGHV